MLAGADVVVDVELASDLVLPLVGAGESVDSENVSDFVDVELASDSVVVLFGETAEVVDDDCVGAELVNRVVLVLVLLLSILGVENDKVVLDCVLSKRSTSVRVTALLVSEVYVLIYSRT